MTTSDWLRHSQANLTQAGISTPRLDCLVLLEDAIGKERAWLLSHPEYELQGSILKKLNTKIVQRARHVPLAYIRGKAEFYGREFVVNAHTLVPRPETEAMIEVLKRVTSSESRVTIVDIGTGSGAIAVTAKLEIPEATVIATDIDATCLETAKKNAQSLGTDITFLHGNLLEPIAEFRSIEVSNARPDTSAFDTLVVVLLCNLPYVPDNFQINTAATHEPRHALFGGGDGLDLYREMFGQIGRAGWKPAYILTESLPPQHEVLAGIALAAGYSLSRTDGFIQLFEL